jgi:ClpP class serine protease
MMNEVLADDTKRMQEDVQTLRADKLIKDAWKSLSGGQILTGEDALKLGLIDGVGNFKKVIAREFPEARLRNMRIFRRSNPILVRYGRFSKGLGFILLIFLIILYKGISYIMKLLFVVFLAPAQKKTHKK